MDLTINERLIEFQKVKGFRWESLRELLGVAKQQQVGNWTKKEDREPIPAKHVLKLIQVFPELNARWLITGEGEMLNKGTPMLANEPEMQYNIKKCNDPACLKELDDLRIANAKLIDMMHEVILRGEKSKGGSRGGLEPLGKSG